MKYTININQVAAAEVAPNLDFNDLAIYDFIKSFATSGNCDTIKDEGRTYYWVSHSVIMSELPMLHISTARGIMKRIENLISAGLLVKYDKCSEVGRTFYAFGINAARLESNTDTTPRTKVQTPRTKVQGGGEKNFGGGMKNFSGNNINNNINVINDNDTPTPENNGENTLFDDVEPETPTPPNCAAPPRPKSAATKTLFRNSEVADRSKFFAAFQDDCYNNIDLEYYYNAVADWSDSSSTMRTSRGWLATVRQFIRGDKEKNKLHLKQTAGGGMNWDFAKKFLNNTF